MPKMPPLLILRHLLSLPPSAKNWRRILALIERAHSKDQKMLAEYAEQHLKNWPDELRVLDFYDDSLPCWRLVRRLDMTRQVQGIEWNDSLYSDYLPDERLDYERTAYYSPWKPAKQITDFRYSVSYVNGDHRAMKSLFYYMDKKLPNIRRLQLLISGEMEECDLDYFGYPKLESLLLRSNFWWSGGARILNVLSQLATLRNLKIQGPQPFWGEALFVDLFTLPPALETLSITGLRGIPQLGFLKNQNSLRELSLGNVSTYRWHSNRAEYAIFSPKDFDALYNLPKLESLRLQRCGSFETLEFLRPLTQLHSLRLSGLTHCEDLSGLEGMTELEELELMGLRELPLATLKPLPSLKRLRIQCQTSPVPLLRTLTEILEERFPRLEQIDLRIPD